MVELHGGSVLEGVAPPGECTVLLRHHAPAHEREGVVGVPRVQPGHKRPCSGAPAPSPRLAGAGSGDHAGCATGPFASGDAGVACCQQLAGPPLLCMSRCQLKVVQLLVQGFTAAKPILSNHVHLCDMAEI